VCASDTTSNSIVVNSWSETRRFKASPHLCYRDKELARIPKNAVLIVDIKHVEILT